jgi:putative tributyrin esterase
MALCTVHWFSRALEKMTAAQVIVPETAPGPFPVLYLLHGLSDDYSAWVRRTSLERYAAAYPFMIVMPDGGRGYSTDAEQGEAHETALIADLIPFIDRAFRTDARRAGRAIGGLSMGGYGALKLALGHPDLFCAATSHSCSRAVTWTHDPTSREPKFTRVFGSNPRGGPNDLFAVAERVDRRLLPALRIDCGTEDALLDGNRRFHAHLEALDIAHEYAEYSGGHDWAYWDQRIQEALRFHQRVFASAA